MDMGFIVTLVSPSNPTCSGDPTAAEFQQSAGTPPDGIEILAVKLA
jgi:hypothetical protein